MRTLAILPLVLALLAGCVDDEPTPVDDVVSAPPEPLREDRPFEGRGRASGDDCFVLFCFGGGEGPSYALGANESLAAARIVLESDGSADDEQVTFRLLCKDGGRGCATGHILGEVKGGPPLVLEIPRTETPPGVRLLADVEGGGDPVSGIFGGGYQLRGTLTVLVHNATAAPQEEKQACYEEGHEGHGHAEQPCEETCGGEEGPCCDGEACCEDGEACCDEGEECCEEEDCPDEGSRRQPAGIPDAVQLSSGS